MVSRSFKAIKNIYESLLSTIYSEGNSCITCHGYSEEYLCAKCSKDIKILGIKTLVEYKGEGYAGYSLGYYSYTIKKLILALKFQKDFTAGKILAGYMSDFIEENLKGKFDLITYIPSSKESLKKRGFNQCLYISNIISERCKTPCEDILKRSHSVKDQIGLDDIKRWENIRGVFSVKEESSIKNKRVLIIDDVITTGATVFFAAKAIKECGSKEVFILTAAKSRV